MKIKCTKALLLLAMLFGLAKHGQAEAIKPGMLTFRYQELMEPWDVYPCEHKLMGEPYDWSVICQVGSQTKVFWVHLAVTFYQRSALGQSAYEILYWVSQQALKQPKQYDSSTIWIHSSKPQATANVLELSQGIENDTSYLRLQVDLRK